MVNTGPQAPTVQSDGSVTGFLWSPNFGWINLSCQNNGTCSAATYGLTVDGSGSLRGYAWAENIGWINMAPANGGVVLDSGSQHVSGYAWSENAGWIRFGMF